MKHNQGDYIKYLAKHKQRIDHLDQSKVSSGIEFTWRQTGQLIIMFVFEEDATSNEVHDVLSMKKVDYD